MVDKIQLIDTEQAFLEKSIVTFEDLMLDRGDSEPTFAEREYSKLDTASQFYDNFYKRVFIDILLNRAFPEP